MSVVVDFFILLKEFVSSDLGLLTGLEGMVGVNILGRLVGTISTYLGTYAQTLILVNLIVVKIIGFLVITRNPPERF